MPWQHQRQPSTLVRVCVGIHHHHANCSVVEGLSDECQVFDIKSKDYTVFRTQTFSWADQGYTTMSRFYDENIAELIDNEFTEIKELTYSSFGSVQNVDTFKFRFAIWNYVYRIKGVVNDGYPYQVNKLLTKEFKTYVQKIVSVPASVTREDFETFSDVLVPSEKVHINLLAMEARKQAELLVGLSAILNFMA
eukprot:m.74500 g.74500  ORF g.74500 m.74500 type:complete len:193 (+) comp8056_c1_seq2:1102-1680(+)